MGDLKDLPQTNTLLHTFASSMVEKKHIQQMLVNPTDENTAPKKTHQKQPATNSCFFC